MLRDLPQTGAGRPGPWRAQPGCHPVGDDLLLHAAHLVRCADRANAAALGRREHAVFVVSESAMQPLDARTLEGFRKATAKIVEAARNAGIREQETALVPACRLVSAEQAVAG